MPDAQRRRPRSRAVWLVVPTLLMLVTGSAAFAQGTSLGGKARSGNQVVVPVEEHVTGNLYVSGGTVRVEGTVDGDLVASGGTVEVPGEVKGDVLVAGGRVDLSGLVGGDVRMAGGQLTVGGTVTGDLLAAGGQATLTSSGRVGQDLIFGTGQMTLDGQVAGNVLGSAGSYTRHGTIGGQERVSVSEQEAPPTFWDRVFGAIRRLVSVLLVAALLLWLLPAAVAGAADTLRRRLPLSLGIGLLGLAGFVVLNLLAVLVVALGSIVFGLLGFGNLVVALVFAMLAFVLVVCAVFYLAAVFAAPAAVGLALGRLVLPGDERGRRWLALTLGVVVLVLLSSIPVVGGFFDFVVMVLGLGAVILALARRRTGRQAVVQPT
jgi:cytoskeletal protein CcmA (bactofilin family)